MKMTKKEKQLEKRDQDIENMTILLDNLLTKLQTIPKAPIGVHPPTKLELASRQFLLKQFFLYEVHEMLLGKI
jgi:hypothetical protein